MSFTVYKSSAGSGKTFSLVREYLVLVLPDPGKFRNILAITFTNKVANEMKERVLGNLKELTKPADQRDKKVTKDLLPKLIEETGLPEEMIMLRADEALAMILHNYSDFAVGTIDSFSHRIIRTFARDFGLPVNFNVEIDSDDLFRNTIDLLLDRVGDDPELTALLVKFLSTRMDEEKSWNIDAILLNFAKVLLDEQAKDHLDKLGDLTMADFDAITSAIYSQIGAFENTLRSIAEKALKLIRDRNIPDSAFYFGSTGISKYFAKLAFNVRDNLEPNSRVRDTLEKDTWTGGKASPAEVQAIHEIKDDLRNLYNELAKAIDEGKSWYFLLKAMTRTIFPVTMLNEIGKVMEGFKKQNNIVHISEFNRRISAFIMNEPVPYIYERLGEKYNHILIDEFQDTSVLQWQNLLPLVENSLSNGYFNLVVGDGKQAIYRWRNGDASQFTGLPAVAGSDKNPVLASRQKILHDHYFSQPLNINYRSKPGIVEFNNRFFGILKPVLGSAEQLVYEKLEQTVDAGKTGGYVSLEFLEKEKEDKNFREQVRERIFGIIGELRSSGFRMKDVAVLCRRNSDASEIARFLIGNNVDVVSSESLLLSHSPEVNFIISFTRFLEDPSDLIIRAELATFLYQKDKLSGITLPGLLGKLTAEPESPASFYELLNANHFTLSPHELLTLPLYDLCEKIIRLFSLNAPADPYIQFFLDFVMKYSRKNASGRKGFLEWWDEHGGKVSVILPQGLDAVNIMTIHKAKGLQFPVVILPFYPEKKMFTKRYLWVDLPGNKLAGLPTCMLEPGSEMGKTVFAKEMEEEENKTLLDSINVLYVAMTRPEERLYVLSPVSPEKTENPGSVPAYFGYFLKNAGEWIDGKKSYEWGKREQFEPKVKDDGIVTLSLTSFLSSDWKETVFIRRSAADTWDVGDPLGNREWGNLLHSLMAQIITPGDSVNVINDMLLSGRIGEKEKNEAEAKIREVMADPKLEQFFTEGATVKTEAEILLEDGTGYRPDRVIIDGDKAVVLDYKTGRPEERHRQQVDLYGKLLKEMGYSSVKKYIVYLDPVIDLVEVA
jgi:ATP-dependent exoDNAse (exonuclease V) beta subunit